MPKKFARIKNSIFTQLLALISLPALFAVLILIISFIIHSQNYKETINKNCISTLENFCRQQDETIQNISHSINILSENSTFLSVADGKILEIGDITYVQNILRRIKANHSLINSIAIFEKSSASIYTENNIYPAKDYFSKIFVYSNYDYKYWDNYMSPLSEKSILSPSTVTDPDNVQKSIIPVVFTRVGNKYLQNIIIVNIDISSIISAYDNYKFSENTSFLLMNKETKQIFCNSSHPVADKDLYDLISWEKTASFNYKNYYAMSYTPKQTALGYTYITLIPDRDLKAATIKFTYILVIIILAALLVLSVIVFIATKKAYMPFKSTLALFDSSDKNENSISTIHSLVASTIDMNKNLTIELKNTLPVLEEQYLIRLLNSSSHYYHTDLNLEDKISFKYNFFCSVIIRFQPNDSFYEKYSNTQEKSIEVNLFEIIYQEFSSHFKTYVIPSNEHTLYILLNTETTQDDPTIENSIEYLDSLLANDSEDIRLCIANGGIFEGLAGLKQSHSNALKKLSGTQWINNLYIKTDETISTKKVLKFSQTDEITIYNNFISGNVDSALHIINSLLDYNASQNITKSGIIQLYIQIFNIIFKVMRAKKIEYDENDLGDIGIINDIIAHDISEIHNIMVTLIDKIRAYISVSRVDVYEILNYIQQNYHKNESFEAIADRFSVSTSYLSRLIKKEVDATFTDYVNTLRISEAKQLLTNTKDTITSIYEKVGFNNRNTFIRLFKQIVGVTPSEYRKSLKQDN